MSCKYPDNACPLSGENHMGRSLLQPLPPGIEVVDSTASGGVNIRLLDDTDFEFVANGYRAQGRRYALREVLELMEAQKYSPNMGDEYMLHYNNLKAKIEAMLR